MATDQRAERLRKLFFKVLHGEQPIKTAQNAQLFLEAARQQPPSACIETIVSKTTGIDALREAVRVDISPSFIIAHTLPFLHYLSDAGIKTLADGQFLREVLVVIAKPPTVWNAALQLFRNRKIPENLLAPFAWLAVELVSLPVEAGVDVLDDVRDISERKTLLKSENHEARELGYRIKKVLQLRALAAPEKETLGSGPGGRHDNDFADFRETSIYPTRDEFLCSQPPFYQTAQDVLETPLDRRANAHLDNQFRLLREDMLAELREDQQVATGAKKGRRVSSILRHLRPTAVEFETKNFGDQGRPKPEQPRLKKCTLLLECGQGLQFPQMMSSPEERKKFLKNQPGILRHQSFGVVCQGSNIFGFAFVDRDIDLLARTPPIISLQFTDGHGLRDTLMALRLPNAMDVQFVLVDTAVFAYEPVLAELQKLKELPLQDALVNPASEVAKVSGGVLGPLITGLIRQLLAARRNRKDPDEPIVLPFETGITVDDSQMSALLLALDSPLSIIQGPPGTGKSYIGAQIAKCFFLAGKTILVISFTNHALDQFLEDLLNAGAKAKCSAATAPLLLRDQKSAYRRSPEAWDIINRHRAAANVLAQEVTNSFQSYRGFSPGWSDISEYLEFSDEDQRFYTALLMPAEMENGGWKQAGKGGRAVGPDYLYRQWIDGKGPGTFAKGMSAESKSVWALPKAERKSHDARWRRVLLEERLQNIQELVRQYNQKQELIDGMFSAGEASILRQKRVVGCTTTGAAKYARLIRAARPDVVIVEEAGEILESHVLTALAPTVKQLVLIGDHKQLRPRAQNYALSVEKGDGFDLNRSLFERLILQGAKHVTLTKQHRMVPEISLFPRMMTYPDLVDGPKTSGRPAMRGIRDRVVFLNHSVLEESDGSIKDRRDMASMKESKKNRFEAEMVLRCIKFFGQQGYMSSQIVILTPYLGQVRVLQDLLRENQHDPELSEMDKRELIRAGLLSEAASKVDRKPIRVSTIDTYQGEENDIVIASLTRSNESGEIGFMSAPERLNVLITRARNCLVMIGNMVTFMQSKKGRPVWHPFFDLLKTHGHLYDGLPVRCEKHPERKALLKEPLDFDKSCPDGGCNEPCLATLKCGKHKCKSRCHRVTDHSQAQCRELVDRVCERLHKTKVPCPKQGDGCQKCIREDQEHERRIRRDLQLEEERQRRQAEYLKKLQELDDEIDHERRITKYKTEEEDQRKTLEQRQADLAAAKASQKRILEQEAKQRASKEAKKSSKQAKAEKAEYSFPDIDDSRAEWEHLKATDGCQSQPLDDLMEMIGLEEVKQEFLSIKSKVDLTTRQGTSLASERFSCSMLGNPGTGKTTNTGAGLANMGVSGCRKLVDEILNDGGGVLFIDEAYQLTSGNNPGGAAVLDYLLAEVENQRGKVVFVLAGYHKQMESFFAHNPGLPSRFPIQMNFADYSDDELLRILELKVNNKFDNTMGCDDGLRGLYCRIIARRIGRGRGKDGFGNARAVENTLSAVYKRQADRLRRERKEGRKPSDLFLTKEDLIGPEPSDALTRCAGWKKLQELFGLGAVKEAVKALVDSIQQNYSRELAEMPLIEYSLNKVFLGNPGTGKTTVAKIYGEILVALGLLSKGEGMFSRYFLMSALLDTRGYHWRLSADLKQLW
ncbi:P-loop containing nucleoside triphosphate hydrolase protein [Podospora conica]|nr:P-loop containing nucleoside triphosphate hydrolase protein [Schizothecium conicum]